MTNAELECLKAFLPSLLLMGTVALWILICVILIIKDWIEMWW